MQEAGAGVSTVTNPGERHRTAPSTHRIAHIGHMRSPPAATRHLQCPPCCRLILAFDCSRATRSIIDLFKAFPQAPPKRFRSTTSRGRPDAAAGWHWSTAQQPYTCCIHMCIHVHTRTVYTQCRSIHMCRDGVEL